MPQMAPTIWLIMLMNILMSLILISVYIYFFKKMTKVSDFSPSSELKKKAWAW